MNLSISAPCALWRAEYWTWAELSLKELVIIVQLCTGTVDLLVQKLHLAKNRRWYVVCWIISLAQPITHHSTDSRTNWMLTIMSLSNSSSFISYSSGFKTVNVILLLARSTKQPAHLNLPRNFFLQQNEKPRLHSTGMEFLNQLLCLSTKREQKESASSHIWNMFPTSLLQLQLMFRCWIMVNFTINVALNLCNCLKYFPSPLLMKWKIKYLDRGSRLSCYRFGLKVEVIFHSYPKIVNKAGFLDMMYLWTTVWENESSDKKRVKFPLCSRSLDITECSFL